LVSGVRCLSSGFGCQVSGFRCQKSDDKGFKDFGIEELKNSGIRELKKEKLIYAFNS
jgi:hypothetical protein